MLSFIAILQKFEQKGEKTGWTYIEIDAEQAQELKPDHKQSFRVKGKLDDYAIQLVALLPMGNGNFIMPINAEMRKGIRKKVGAMVEVCLEVDNQNIPISGDFMACLENEPECLTFYQSLTKGHQNYYTKWIESAKTTETKAKRIAQAIEGFSMGMGFGEMMRYFKEFKSK